MRISSSSMPPPPLSLLPPLLPPPLSLLPPLLLRTDTEEWRCERRGAPSSWTSAGPPPRGPLNQELRKHDFEPTFHILNHISNFTVSIKQELLTPSLPPLPLSCYYLLGAWGARSQAGTK